MVILALRYRPSAQISLITLAPLLVRDKTDPLPSSLFHTLHPLSGTRGPVVVKLLPLRGPAGRTIAEQTRFKLNRP